MKWEQHANPFLHQSVFDKYRVALSIEIFENYYASFSMTDKLVKFRSFNVGISTYQFFKMTIEMLSLKLYMGIYIYNKEQLTKGAKKFFGINWRVITRIG